MLKNDLTGDFMDRQIKHILTIQQQTRKQTYFSLIKVVNKLQLLAIEVVNFLYY